MFTVGSPFWASGDVDPFYDDTILIWNMRDAVGVSPPTDDSKYRKVHTTYAGQPLYGVDSSDGPFVGCGSNDHTYSGVTPSRSSGTDVAWDFVSNTQTLTIEGWVKVPPINGNARISTIRAIQSAGSGNWFWPWFQRAAGVVRAGVDVIGSSIIDTSSGAASGIWVHYATQYIGDTIYMGVNGTRIGSAVAGNATYSDLMLQCGNTTIGTITGAGAMFGPHRVTIANRYNLDTSSTYAVPTKKFPVR